MYPRYKRIKSGFLLYEKNGYVQSVPYRRALPYRVWGGRDVITDNMYPPDPSSWLQPQAAVWINDETGTSKKSRSYAKAYDQFVSRVKGEANAMLAVNIAERKQSFDMIHKRGLQLLECVRSLRKGDISGFLKASGFTKRKRRNRNQWVRTGKGRTYTLDHSQVQRDEYAFQKRAKTGGSLWLEYWFGWKPLIGDIFSSVEVLQGQPPTTYRRNFSGSGSMVDSWATFYQFPDGYSFNRQTFLREVRSRVFATVDIENSDLFKANQLGLVNPATVAWELVPFSFLVDWFLPVSKFLDSYTDLLGLKVSNCFVSTKSKVTFTSNGRSLDTPFNRIYSTVSNAYEFTREVVGALPIPGLLDRRGTAIQSWSRAATSISLLTAFMQRTKWST